MIIFEEHIPKMKPISPEQAEIMNKLFESFKKYNTEITITWMKHEPKVLDSIKKLLNDKH